MCVAQAGTGGLQGRRNAYLRFQHEHPEALRRLDLLDEQIASATWELDTERQGLDGIRPERLLPAHHADGVGRPLQRVVVDADDQPALGRRGPREPDDQPDEGETKPRKDCLTTRQPVAHTVRR